MAGSRLEKLGTIFGRITALLHGGAMKRENRPKWYDVYQAFPPLVEPTFGKHTREKPIRDIFYPEDTIRAIFHKKLDKKLPIENLIDGSSSSVTRRVINIVQQKMNADITLSEAKAVDQAIELLKSEGVFYVSRHTQSTHKVIPKSEVSAKQIFPNQDRKSDILEENTESDIKIISDKNIDVKNVLKDE